MPFIDPAQFASFNNAHVTITRDGEPTISGTGARIPGAPVDVLTDVPCQEWPLQSSDKEGFTGEQILLMKKLRLDQYYSAGTITEKMVATVDGVAHNIVLVSDDGSKSVTILTLRRQTG